MEVDASIYRSPKRKRGQPSRGPSLVTSSLSQSLSATTLTTTDDQHDEHGSHSPSTRIARKFQKLELRSPIDLPPSLIDYSPVQEIRETPTPPTSTNSPKPQSPLRDFKPPESADFNFESPITTSVISTPPSTQPPHPTTSTSPAARSSRIRSPPPSHSPPTPSTSQFWWTASEITGWTPDDPDEDNYGLNGVGYAKPAAKAWAISQKRKQQIAEYRSRETREARQRRHQRRLSGSRAGSRRGSPKAVEGGDFLEGLRERKEGRVVHFDDG